MSTSANATAALVAALQSLGLGNQQPETLYKSRFLRGKVVEYLPLRWETIEREVPQVFREIFDQVPRELRVQQLPPPAAPISEERNESVDQE